MEMPKKFIMPKAQRNDEAETTGLSIPWGRLVRGFLLIAFVLSVLTYGFFQVKGVYDRVQANWDELKFTYEKPELVKPMREDYQKKQAELDNSFTQREKSPEDQLIEAVVDKVQAQPSK